MKQVRHDGRNNQHHPLAGCGGTGAGISMGSGSTGGGGGAGATTSSQHPHPITNSMDGIRRTLNKFLRDFILPPFLG